MFSKVIFLESFSNFKDSEGVSYKHVTYKGYMGYMGYLLQLIPLCSEKLDQSTCKDKCN